MLASLAHNIQTKQAENFVLHYVSMICLQLYLIERSQFMHSAGDAQHNFSEASPSWICQLYMRYDFKREGFPIDLDKISLGDAARKYDYISLVYSVLMRLLPSLNSFLNTEQMDKFKLQLTQESIDKWCKDKLFTTRDQMLVSSGFVRMHVHAFSQTIHESMDLANTSIANHIVVDTLTKHFKLIKQNKQVSPFCFCFCWQVQH